jgi:hypothetical protein
MKLRRRFKSPKWFGCKSDAASKGLGRYGFGRHYVRYGGYVERNREEIRQAIDNRDAEEMLEDLEEGEQ